MTEFYKIIVSVRDGKMRYRLYDVTEEPFLADEYFPSDIKYLNDPKIISSITNYIYNIIDVGMDKQSLYEILNHNYEQGFNKKGNIIITTWIGL